MMSRNKPLPESVLTNSPAAIWCHPVSYRVPIVSILKTENFIAGPPFIKMKKKTHQYQYQNIFPATHLPPCGSMTVSMHEISVWSH